MSNIFGTTLPIIQAPMAGVQTSALALAVSQAGGLGSLPAAMLSLDTLRQELITLKAQTTQPININFFCHTPPTPNPQTEHAWQTLLKPYFQEAGLSLNAMVTGAGRMPFNASHAALLAEFKPAIVSFHFGLPDAALLAPIRAWGGKIIASATTLDEALWLERHGVDAVIAQGLEAGGHRGHFLSHDLTQQLGTFALVPQLVKALNVPVIAAGGIANAQGVKAALQLGASAVQVGTAYLLAHEATTSLIHRQALQSPDSRHTALTNLFTGRPARGIVNRVMRELGYLNPAAPEFPLASNALLPLRTYFEAQGRSDFTPLWAGQNASECQARSAGAITRALAAQV